MGLIARKLGQCHNISDLRELASRRLPKPIFDYLDGAAEDEYSANRSVARFDDVQLVPRVLIDMAEVATRTDVLGCSIEWPFIGSPAGMVRMYDPQGELAVARALAGSGTMYGLSIASSFDLEAVARASDGPKMFQIYIFRDRSINHELMERARAAGYRAVCLTVDAAVRGRRERELRTGIGIPLELSMKGMAQLAARPRWVAGQVGAGPLAMPNFAARTGSANIVDHARFMGEHLDPSVTWEDAREMVAAWKGPFALKGILSVDDALRAIDIGASAIIVSVHGGRQIDGAVSPLDVLPEIARAVKGKIEIILEGGIRRGSHILKALALGADAVASARPYLFGLGAGGEKGAELALKLLRTELIRTMQLSGCKSVRDVAPDLVRVV